MSDYKELLDNTKHPEGLLVSISGIQQLKIKGEVVIILRKDLNYL